MEFDTLDEDKTEVKSSETGKETKTLTNHSNLCDYKTSFKGNLDAHKRNKHLSG